MIRYDLNFDALLDWVAEEARLIGKTIYVARGDENKITISLGEPECPFWALQPDGTWKTVG